MVDRFTSMLDCVELGFLPDGILDQLPAPSQLAATRIGGIDMNIPRVRAALAAALALAVAPAGFTVAAVHRPSAGDDRTDPRRTTASARAPTTCASSAANNSSSNPAAPAATTSPSDAARTITALLTLRDKVIAPLIAGIRTPRRGRPPKHWTTDRPRLRNPPPRHADPAQRPRHRDQGNRHIDNDIVDRVPQPSSRRILRRESG